MPTAASRQRLNTALERMRSRIAIRGADHDLNLSAYAEADRLFEQARFRDALRLFEAAAAADPEDGAAFMAIGNCWDALRKPKRAEQAFRTALRFSPPSDQPGILFNLGNALLDQGLFAQALAVYNSIPPGSSVSDSAHRNARLAAQGVVRAL